MARRHTAGTAAALTSRTPWMTKNAHHPAGFQRPYRSIPPGDMFPTAWRRYAVGTQEALTANHGQPNSATASGPRSWIARLPRLLSLRRCWNFPGSFAKLGAFLRALRPTSNVYEVPGINGCVSARRQATVLIVDKTYVDNYVVHSFAPREKLVSLQGQGKQQTSESYRIIRDHIHVLVCYSYGIIYRCTRTSTWYVYVRV